MRTAQPPGRRSTLHGEAEPGDGGKWDYPRDHTGRAWFILDVEDFKSGLAESDRQILMEELLSKMGRAQTGQLTYGKEAQFDVYGMERKPNVLELRLQDYSGYPEDDPHDGDPQLRHVRLYFSEPEELASTLLALALRSKRPGPFGLEEQNGHIDLADSRLVAFEVRLRRESLRVQS